MAFTNYIPDLRRVYILVFLVCIILWLPYHGDFTSARLTTGRPLKRLEDTYHYTDCLQLDFCDISAWFELQEPELLFVDRSLLMDWTCKCAAQVLLS